MSITEHMLSLGRRWRHAWRPGSNGRAGEPVDAAALAGAIEHHLWGELLPVWFPRCVDAAGGFSPLFDSHWRRRPESRRSVVYQARMTWTAAEAAQHCTDDATRDVYADHARHGADYLLRVFHDTTRGGFFWVIDAEAGSATESLGMDKHLYGQGFVIYALAAAHGATGELRYLNAATELFHWIDVHARDVTHGGYDEQLRFDGRQREMTDRLEDRSVFVPDTPNGYKTANTHLHLLEAFTVLHRHWPDARLTARLTELLELLGQGMIVPPGCMHALFTADWRPVPMHHSFGHDVEAAVLLMEAAAALGREDDAWLRPAVRSLVDHALAAGFDHHRGGLAAEGQAFGAVCDGTRVWWVQAEMLQALARMHEHAGDDGPRYLEAMSRQWRFIERCVVDRTHGGWHEAVDARGRPASGQRKAHAWKAAYHEVRALLNAARSLRGDDDAVGCGAHEHARSNVEGSSMP